MSEYSKALRQALKEAGKTQRQLAQDTGVSDAYVSTLCSGKARPTAGMVLKVERALSWLAEVQFQLMAVDYLRGLRSAADDVRATV